MKHLLIALLVFSAGSFAQAQTAKVIKVKGQQAIVQFPSGTVPQVGQQLDVSGNGGYRDESGAPTTGGSRRYVLGLGLNNLFFMNSSVDNDNRTGINLNGRFGLNSGRMEYGGIGTIGYESRGDVTNRTLAAGGFFDFNFSPNVSGRAVVYGVGGDLQFGQEVTDFGVAETTTTIIPFFVGGHVKYFGLSDHFAIRGDAGLSVERSTPEGGSSTTLIGAMVRASLNAYF